MQVRTFESITLNATTENVNHANSMNMDYKVNGKKLIVYVAPNAYQFASTPAKLKKTLGF